MERMKTTGMKRRGYRFSAAGLRQAAAAGLLFVLVAFPQRAFAQCEPDGTAQATAQNIASTESSYLSGTIVPNIENGWNTDIVRLRTALGQDGKANADEVMSKLNSFWNLWITAWQNMTAQLSAATLDQSRQMASFNDASNALTASRDEGEERVKSVQRYQPTVAACRFDTTASVVSPSRQISTALQDGYEWDFVQLGNNEKDSAAQYGPADEQSHIWYNYKNIFCDYRAENGNAGCGPDPIDPTKYTPPLSDSSLPGYAILPGGWFSAKSRNDQNLLLYANMDAEPSLLIFAQYTIDMFNETEMTAVNQMIFNVTGYRIPQPMVNAAMGSTVGMEETLKRRQYITQMDTVGALLYSLISNRAPGPASPNLYELRTQEYGATPNQNTSSVLNPSWWDELTTIFDSKQWLQYESQAKTPPDYMLEASLTPSQREIRESIIEQLWNPSYYKDLYDNPSTVMQKDVYLKAYSLVLLYDMIERQEKISDVYALET
ncbi:MAG: hypothetical protein KGQ70_08860, partial [Alphaproteobacteria bacterium]|nr:hypothetical protein [Alphaproteobacteria bacterium]